MLKQVSKKCCHTLKITTTVIIMARKPHQRSKYTEKSKRVIDLLAQMKAAVAKIDLANAPRGKTFSGHTYPEDHIIPVMDLCDNWVATEEAYYTYVMSLPEAERDAKNAKRKAMKTNSLATLLSAVMKIMEKDRENYPWWDSFRCPRLTQARTQQMEEVLLEKKKLGLLVGNYQSIYDWAEKNVDKPGLGPKQRITALGILGFSRGVELYDTDYTFQDNGVHTFANGNKVTSLLVLKNGVPMKSKSKSRMKKGTPCWCSFAKWQKGIDLLREDTRNLAIQQNRLENFKSVPVMKAFGAAHVHHFKKNATYHKVRILGVARCYYEDMGHLPVNQQSNFVGYIKSYLAHAGDGAANYYELMRFDPTMEVDTFVHRQEDTEDTDDTESIEEDAEPLVQEALVQEPLVPEPLVPEPPPVKRSIAEVENAVQQPVAKKSKAVLIKELFGNMAEQMCAIMETD